MDGRPIIKWGAAWFPKGIADDIAITTLELCSLQHDTFHFGLGTPEPCLPVCVMVTLYRASPPHLSPPPMWPSVRIRITLSMDDGLDICEAERATNIT